jgi:hypothetical protein
MLIFMYVCADVMAPSFLKDIRRRSRASFRTDKSTDSSNGTNGSVPTTKSSSTLNSTFGGTTPPILTNSTSASNLQSLGNLPPPLPPTRPTISTSLSNRHSVSGMSGLGSPSQKSNLPTSPYAPRILSISDNTWVGLGCWIFLVNKVLTGNRFIRKCYPYTE